jgi:hypothetical protein
VRYVVAVVALAPFVLLMVAMATGRARVRACCPAPPIADAPVHEQEGPHSRIPPVA